MALFLTQNLFVASGIDYLIYLIGARYGYCGIHPSLIGTEINSTEDASC